MLGSIFSTALPQNRCQRVLVALLVDRAADVVSDFTTRFRVPENDTRHELAEENRTAIAKDGSVLLGPVCFNSERTIADNSAFEHDCSWLVHRHFCVA